MDSFADAGDEASAKKAKDALLVGSEGGLDVFRVLSNRLEVVGRLEGLRGAVIGAKILPHWDRTDVAQQIRPLVAVVIHGAVSKGNHAQGRDLDGFDSVDDVASANYQTTVDVYSLQTQARIATLFESAPMPFNNAATPQLPSAPEPVDAISVHAEGRFLTVASGRSGEVFVFTMHPPAEDMDPEFRCIGKFWTSVQTSLSSSASRPTSAGDSSADASAQETHGKPLYSLSSRWLAIVPPLLSSTISIQGTPLVADINPSPPGITTHAAPSQPVITCEVVGSDVEGAWSRMGKAAAQSLFKYSAKGIEMGLQGWKELTHPTPPPSGRQQHDRTPSERELFPPTKGPGDDPARHAKEPALVSLIDLESLLQWEEHKPKLMPSPFATFALLDGCNFLSLSTSGTRLLTASRKGELSIVWDLAQVAHGVSRHASPSDDEAATSQCIKQLHRIPRSTPSIVLQCVWSRDDDMLAMLTAHGTVHLHEIPSRPMVRKRKRRNTSISAPAPEKAGATVSLDTALSPPSSNQGFMGSIKSWGQSMSSQYSSMRSSNPASALGIPISLAGFREATAAAGTAGSRAVAKGISQGFTAAKGGASDYWHSDNNKIKHKALQDPTSASSLRWMKRNNAACLAIVCGGTVYTHHIQRFARLKGNDVVKGLKHERYAQKHFALPNIATRAENRALHHCSDQGPHGFWTLRHSTPPPRHDQHRHSSAQSAKAMQNQVNDVETNPPYCPFHVDPGANISTFSEHDQGSQFDRFDPSASYDDFQSKGHALTDEAWTFGDALPPALKVNEHVSERSYGGSADDADEDVDGDADGLVGMMESKLTVEAARDGEININTRPRKGRGRLAGGNVGFDDVLVDDDEEDDSLI